jgi:BirA family biotin operon repressor/biotin-[acetyl-CoA-carboxylase] ligase
MVVATDHQVGGRGRLGRRWSDQAGEALMFSVLLRPSLAPGQAHLISLAAGLAVAQVLEALPGLAGRVSVKWPNDVLIDERKVCGILVEGSMDVDRLHWVVVGVGVNVNGDSDSLSRAINEQGDEGADVRPQPVSLEEASGAVVPRAALFARLLARLTDLFRSLDTGTAGAEELLLGLRTRDALKGRTVEVFGGSDMRHVMARGTAAGIGSEGQLLVRTAGGEVVSVVAGDVSLRRVTE